MTNPGWQLLLGPAGALVLSIALVWLLLQSEMLVPGRFYRESEKRNEALEEENRDLHRSLSVLAEQAAAYREQLAAVTAELKAVREQLEEVRRELAVLKGQRGGA